MTISIFERPPKRPPIPPLTPPPRLAGVARRPAPLRTPEPAAAVPEPPCEELTDLILRNLASERDEDRRRMTRYVLAAAVFHAFLLLVTFPQLPQAPRELTAKPAKVYVVRQVRFKQLPPRQQQIVPKKKARKIPIPDPTPDDPEPIVVEDLAVPEVDIIADDLVFGIPEAPPIGPGAGGTGKVWEVGGEIAPPRNIFKPRPIYTEEARIARVQGIVILMAIIDREGNVTEVETLKDLPMGLTEEATKAVLTWKYEPATRRGVPVAVRMHLSVNFSIQ